MKDEFPARCRDVNIHLQAPKSDALSLKSLHCLRSLSDRPHVELLQWLARSSLKQNLPRAIRLWVWLHTLYGKDRLPLSEAFTFANWDTFFSPSHPKGTNGEAAPDLHDPQCAYARTTAA